jgi:hypothetical protein
LKSRVVGFIGAAAVRTVVHRPIKSGLEFEAAFPVKGRVLEVILCPDCEAEGYIRMRIAKDPKRGWSYDPKDSDSFVEIYGLDPRGSYLKVRAGEWAEGRVVAFGYLKRVRTRRIEMGGPVLQSGARLVGAVHVKGTVEIDFGLFRAQLAFEGEEQRRKILKDAGLKDGSFAATDVGVDVELKRWGTKDSILRRT